MKIATWNIRLGIQHGIDVIAEHIKEIKPDILLVQEIGSLWPMGPSGNVPERLAEACGFSYVDFSPSIDLRNTSHHQYLPKEIFAEHTTGQYGHAIFCGPGVEASHHSIITLHHHIDEPRTLLTTNITYSGFSFQILSTHLSTYDEERRVEVGTLHNILNQSHQQPIIIGGDLNEKSLDTKEWLQCLSKQMTVAPNDVPTYPTTPSTKKVVPKPCILDYLMANFGTWEKVEVVDTQDASDHYPVVATLKL